MGARGFDHCALPGLIYFASAAKHRADEIVLGRVLWTVGVAGTARTSRERFGGPVLMLAPPRAQHYVQAMCQLSIYVYWGWYWRPVYDHAWLLAAQLLFAYILDMLLSWTRRGSYLLGFGPLPIIFSTNLFLWFKDEWFYLQFALVAVGVLGKEFVRWNREGRYVHIFNPSAFTLGLFSVVLLDDRYDGPHLGTRDSVDPEPGPAHLSVPVSRRPDCALLFFCDSCDGFCRGDVDGTQRRLCLTEWCPVFPGFRNSSAVFLGLHLLVTDPSTSPRTPLGRLVFGLLYGAGVFVLYSLLGSLGQPTFYDKLMCVPLLNLSVPWIDRVVRSLGERPLLHRLGLDPPLGRLNVAHMAVWITFFLSMTALGRTDGRHTGDSLPFWMEACNAQRPNACPRLIQLETTYCDDNSGWACNEMGLHHLSGKLVASDKERAQVYFARGCETRFQAACLNVLDPAGEKACPTSSSGFAPASARRRAQSGGDARVRTVFPCVRAWMDICLREDIARHPKLITNPKPPIAPPAVATRTWSGYLIVATIIAGVALLLYLRGDGPAPGAGARQTPRHPPNRTGFAQTRGCFRTTCFLVLSRCPPESSPWAVTRRRTPWRLTTSAGHRIRREAPWTFPPFIQAVMKSPSHSTGPSR